MFNQIIQTPFLLPTSVISNGTITGNPFTSPNDILLVDGAFATSNPYQAADIIVGNYLTNLPQNAIVTGIEMKVIGKRGSQTIPPISLTIQALDNTSGQDIFFPFTAPFTGLTTANAEYILGTTTYLFATAWTPTQINNLKFALIANGDISIDSFLLSVLYYVPAPVILPPPPAPGTCIECDSPIQVQAMYLELPFLIGETKFYLKKGSFSYPDNTPVQPGDVGICGGKLPFVFDESKRKGNGQNFEENVEVDTNLGTWTVLPSGVIEVDIGLITQRGLDFKTPGTHVASLMSNHDANSKVIISNNETYNLRLLRTCQVNTVFSAPIIIEDQGVPLPSPAHNISFEGAGVSTANDGGDPFRKIVTIPGFNVVPPSVITSISFFTNTPVINYSTPSINITGTDRFIGIALTLDAGVTVTSALINGVAVATITSSAIGTFVVFALDQVAPSLGIHTLDLVFSGLTRVAGNMILYNQVDQVTPIAPNVALGGNSALISISPTTTTNNSVVFHAFGTGQFPILYTAGGGESIISQTVAGQLQSGIENQSVGTPALVVTQVSLSAVRDWADIAFGINGIVPIIPLFSLEVQDEGIPVELNTTKMNFVGAGVVVTPGAPGEVIVTVLGGGGGGGNYVVDQTPDNGTYGLLAGAVDGVNTTFTVSQAAYVSSSLVVFKNGVAQEQGVANDFVETTPAAGTFDFVVAPLITDIITVIYQTANTIAQVGVQFEDEGVALGTPGSVDEVDFVGAGVTATRVGNRVTVTIPGGGGGGNYSSGVFQQAGNDLTPLSIPHGLGVIPSRIRITAIGQYGANALSTFQSIGTYDGINTNTVYGYNSGGGGFPFSGIDTIRIIRLVYSDPSEITGFATIDAVNIDLTWGIAGSPSQQSYLWEAYV